MRGRGREMIIKLMRSMVVTVPVERIKGAEVFLFFSLPPPHKKKRTCGQGVRESLRELGVFSLVYGG